MGLSTNPDSRYFEGPEHIMARWGDRGGVMIRSNSARHLAQATKEAQKSSSDGTVVQIIFPGNEEEVNQLINDLPKSQRKILFTCTKYGALPGLERKTKAPEQPKAKVKKRQSQPPPRKAHPPKRQAHPAPSIAADRISPLYRAHAPPRSQGEGAPRGPKRAYETYAGAFDATRTEAPRPVNKKRRQSTEWRPGPRSGKPKENQLPPNPKLGLQNVGNSNKADQETLGFSRTPSQPFRNETSRPATDVVRDPSSHVAAPTFKPFNPPAGGFWNRDHHSIRLNSHLTESWPSSSDRCFDGSQIMGLKREVPAIRPVSPLEEGEVTERLGAGGGTLEYLRLLNPLNGTRDRYEKSHEEWVMKR